MKNKLIGAKTSLTFKIKTSIKHKNILIFVNNELRNKLFNEWANLNIFQIDNVLYYQNIVIEKEDLEYLKLYFDTKFLKMIDKFSNITWKNEAKIKGPITEAQIDAYNKFRNLLYDEVPLSNEEILSNFNKVDLIRELNSLFAIYRNDYSIYIESTTKQVKYLNKLYRLINDIDDKNYKKFDLNIDRRVASIKINEFLEILNNKNNKNRNNLKECEIIDFNNYKSHKNGN